MRALRLTETGLCLDYNAEVPPLDEEYNVLVKVFYAGICRTDLSIAQKVIPAKKDVILGHEFCGVITGIYNNSCNEYNLKIGDTVTANPMEFGASGDSMCGKETDGCFAEFIRVPAKNIVKLDKSLLSPLGAFFEPVAASLAPYKYINSPAPLIGIYGNNRIAQLTFQIGKILKFNPVIISEENQLSPDYFDIIVETEISNLKILLKSLKFGGILILKSRNFCGLSIVPNDIVMKELKIIGARYGDFILAKQLLQQSSTMEDPNLVFTNLFGDTFLLEEFQEAFNKAALKDAKKLFFKICAE